MNINCELTPEALREKIVRILYGELAYQQYLAIPHVYQYADYVINQILALIPTTEEIRKQVLFEVGDQLLKLETLDQFHRARMALHEGKMPEK